MDAAFGITVTYNTVSCKFSFSPSVNIALGTDCFEQLGFLGIAVDMTESDVPIQLYGPSRIHVNTDLPLYTIPPSGRLGTIPVNVKYGELLSYFDESGSQPCLCTGHNVDHISVELVDQDNNPLVSYFKPDDHLGKWGMILSIEDVPNQGFDSFYLDGVKEEQDIIEVEN